MLADFGKRFWRVNCVKFRFSKKTTKFDEICKLIIDLLTLKEVGGALCFEWGFTRTFSGNQDVAVK